MELRPTPTTAGSQAGQIPDRVTGAAAGGWRTGLAVAAVLAVACVAISGRSLWIDEACTAMKAAAPTLGAWWREMVTEPSAELQLPLYMLYMWGWGRLFGAGEWSLHAANVPWFFAGAVAFMTAFPPADRRRVAAACVVLLCPFAWYYLDEARPYSMQLGATLMIVGSLLRLERALRVPLAANAGAAAPMGLFLFGLVVLSGSSLLGMVWAGAALAVLPVLLSLSRVVTVVKRYWYLWLVAGGLMLALTGFYLWTLSLGARASAMATTTLGSVLFIGYELLGFSGLGPGRLELRSARLAALWPYLPWLALYGASAAIVVGAALLREVREKDRRRLAAALFCAVPAGFLLAVGLVSHFRVLGRHFSPLLPALLLVFASGLSLLWSRGRVWARVVALVFCVLSLMSCLSLRFSSRHVKDNYRAAAAVARMALGRGQVVWWNAAPEGARYYNVPLTMQPGSAGMALLVRNAAQETLENWPAPDTVIASKPDVYDGHGGLAAYLRAQRFQPVQEFPAFVIWERSGPSLKAR